MPPVAKDANACEVRRRPSCRRPSWRQKLWLGQRQRRDRDDQLYAPALPLRSVDRQLPGEQFEFQHVQADYRATVENGNRGGNGAFGAHSCFDSACGFQVLRPRQTVSDDRGFQRDDGVDSPQALSSISSHECPTAVLMAALHGIQE